MSAPMPTSDAAYGLLPNAPRAAGVSGAAAGAAPPPAQADGADAAASAEGAASASVPHLPPQAPRSLRAGNLEQDRWAACAGGPVADPDKTRSDWRYSQPEECRPVFNCSASLGRQQLQPVHHDSRLPGH